MRHVYTFPRVASLEIHVPIGNGTGRRRRHRQTDRHDKTHQDRQPGYDIHDIFPSRSRRPKRRVPVRRHARILDKSSTIGMAGTSHVQAHPAAMVLEHGTTIDPQAPLGVGSVSTTVPLHNRSTRRQTAALDIRAEPAVPVPDLDQGVPFGVPPNVVNVPALVGASVTTPLLQPHAEPLGKMRNLDALLRVNRHQHPIRPINQSPLGHPGPGFRGSDRGNHEQRTGANQEHDEQQPRANLPHIIHPAFRVLPYPTQNGATPRFEWFDK